MSFVSIRSSAEKYVISVDKKLASDVSLFDMFRRLRLEELARKANFGKEILSLPKAIDRAWWKKNAGKFMKVARA